MRKVILTALIAATVLPTVAMAQPGEMRRDRYEQRRYDDARRGDQRDGRQGYRDDRGDRNRNWGRDDWRGYRTSNRAIYARGDWRAPFRYNSFRAGVRIQPAYYGSRYWINDPYRYRLPTVGYGQRWVRHYDDVLLIDTRRGVVVDVIRSFFW